MQVGDVTPNNPVEPQDIINRERTSKYEKRVIALDLSACMCLSLCTSVFAAESNMQSQIEIEIRDPFIITTISLKKVWGLP